MPAQNYNQTKDPKFTRGEKCLFVHLIITFSLLILMTIIYYVHLCLVNHTKSGVLSTYRRSHDKRLTKADVADFESTGMVFLNTTPTRVVCNILLLSERWSLGPAQCTSMREDPDMSDYLFLWKIKYKIKGKNIYSNIKRCLTHSRFNRGDFQSNIGLFEHQDNIRSDKYYVAPRDVTLNDDVFERNKKQMALVDWEMVYTKKGDLSEAMIHRVRPIPYQKCLTYANPITKLRDYEFCVTFSPNGPTADHGALLVMNTNIVGFFSWGDIRARGVPLIILNILHFRDWFEGMASF